MNAKEFIEGVASELTNGRATVECREDDMGAVFEINSEATTNGLIVGKQYATIEAIRVIAKALGYNGKHRIKVILRERPQKTRQPA